MGCLLSKNKVEPIEPIETECGIDWNYTIYTDREIQEIYNREYQNKEKRFC